MPVAIPDTVLQIDGGILLFIQNNLRSPFLTQFFKTVSNYGFIVLAVYFVIMLMWEKRKIFPIASACIVSGLLGNFIKDYLKHLVKRPRPFLDFSALEPLIKRPKGYSFPSGHTTVAFAVAFIACRILPKRYSIPALLIAALIAFSRLYLGVHYPTDVLGAMCVGYVAALITEFLYKR
jgi:undecaprenyl-diphosphatase